MKPINRFFLKVSIEELNKYLGDSASESTPSTAVLKNTDRVDLPKGRRPGEGDKP